MMCGKLVAGEPAARQCLGLGPSSALKVSTKVFFFFSGTRPDHILEYTVSTT